MEKDNNTNTQKESQIPLPPRTLDYNVVCQMIGHLYIELNNSRSSLDGNYSAIIDNLTTQVSELIAENEGLKEIVSEEGLCTSSCSSTGDRAPV